MSLIGPTRRLFHAIGLRTLAILVMATVTLVAGCAAAMSPGAKLRNDVFWEAATQCESRYRTLHLDRIDIGGGISLHADAESHGELDAFTRCYRQAVNDRVDQRRRAGQPIPDELTVAPTVELD
jgi:hypothetical protein